MRESGEANFKLLIYLCINWVLTPPPLRLIFRSVPPTAWLPKDPLYFFFSLFLCSISCPTAFCCKY